MARQIPPIRTGQINNLDLHIPNFKKAIFMSILDAFMEEVFITAEVYAIHHGRTVINKQDTLKSIKYELLSSEGCGLELKELFQQTMHDDYNTRTENKESNNNNSQGKLFQRVVNEHLPIAEQDVIENKTSSQHFQNFITSASLKRLARRKRKHEEINDAENPTENDTEIQNENNERDNEQENDGDDDEEDEQEDGDDNNNNNVGSNINCDTFEEDASYKDDNENNIQRRSSPNFDNTTCDCKFCIEVDHIFTQDTFYPQDELEVILWNAYQSISAQSISSQ